LHVWIALDDVSDSVLVLDHVVQRNALRAFGVAEQQPRVAAGNEAFRDKAEKIKREDRENQANRDRVKRMQQNFAQRPLRELQHAVVDTFGESPPTTARRMGRVFVQSTGAKTRPMRRAVVGGDS